MFAHIDRYLAVWYCMVCNTQFDSSITHHMLIHTTPENICACGLEFERAHDLLEHFHSIHVQRRYQCLECSYVTPVSWSIGRHIREHRRNFD